MPSWKTETPDPVKILLSIGREHVSRLFLALCVVALAACASAPRVDAPVEQPEPAVELAPPKIALVLGGGAAKGFAHIGVIKALEANGITPDIVVGTSAGSVVGALYASGYNAFDLQRIALTMDETTVRDWVLPNRGFIRGESLQKFVNEAVQNRPIERLNRKLAVVATDLQTGEQIVFETGNTGLAVRASSSVPGIFQPVKVGDKEYVDGGLVSPVPVGTARSLGADIVIAIDISDKPQMSRLRDTFDVLLQTFTIMGRVIAAEQLKGADVIIKPDITSLSSTTFDSRNYAIIEGERAGFSAITRVQEAIAEYYESAGENSAAMR